jgi:hypothetical protein
MDYAPEIPVFVEAPAAYADELWPGSFRVAPRPGDWMRSKSGVVLRVVSLTHEMSDRGFPKLIVTLGEP